MHYGCPRSLGQICSESLFKMNKPSGIFSTTGCPNCLVAVCAICFVIRFEIRNLEIISKNELKSLRIYTHPGICAVVGGAVHIYFEWAIQNQPCVPKLSNQFSESQVRCRGDWWTRTGRAGTFTWRRGTYCSFQVKTSQH